MEGQGTVRYCTFVPYTFVPPEFQKVDQGSGVSRRGEVVSEDGIVEQRIFGTEQGGRPV